MSAQLEQQWRAGVRVVLADDEPTILDALVQLLGKAGYQVVGIAIDGASALKTVEDLRPDVLVVDFRMPGVTAIDVAARLRARVPEVRVIILSADDDANLQMAAERVPVAAYLVKGCSSLMIFRAIDQAAGLRKVRDAPCIPARHHAIPV